MLLNLTSVSFLTVNSNLSLSSGSTVISLLILARLPSLTVIFEVPAFSPFLIVITVSLVSVVPLSSKMTYGIVRVTSTSTAFAAVAVIV